MKKILIIAALAAGIMYSCSEDTTDLKSEKNALAVSAAKMNYKSTLFTFENWKEAQAKTLETLETLLVDSKEQMKDVQGAEKVAFKFTVSNGAAVLQQYVFYGKDNHFIEAHVLNPGGGYTVFSGFDPPEFDFGAMFPDNCPDGTKSLGYCNGGLAFYDCFGQSMENAMSYGGMVPGTNSYTFSATATANGYYQICYS